MDNECTCTCLPVREVTDDGEGIRSYIVPRMCDYCRAKERKELIKAQQDKAHG
jgi:hypothetical protein